MAIPFACWPFGLVSHTHSAALTADQAQTYVQLERANRPGGQTRLMAHSISPSSTCSHTLPSAHKRSSCRAPLFDSSATSGLEYPICASVAQYLCSMASANLLHDQHRSFYNTWTEGNETDESVAFGDANHGFDDSIKFWIDANNEERQRIDSVTEWDSNASFDCLDATHAQVYGYTEHLYGAPSTLTETQQAPTFNELRVTSEPQLTPGQPWDVDFMQEEGSQRLACSECRKDFANMRALDKHTQKTSHKAWRCSEPECGKSYARRDTFLRHRAAHKENSHPCFACFREGREKVFKRKDHLREHVRSCHTKCSEGIRSVCPQFAIIPESTTD